ncbi:hypothetical protein [Halomonas maura]|uniref:hypothetical protein n=1 Tax=Halomonas maura TaxID=117606 RepID=UPI0025B4452B|nr:hypothetical protein [Halomonas maura]MDN3557483.1 hypothetical protein [Halomonas maura]
MPALPMILWRGDRDASPILRVSLALVLGVAVGLAVASLLLPGEGMALEGERIAEPGRVDAAAAAGGSRA